jgi:acetyltransferase-like isoleucine patch superfamily enzyme
VAVGERVRIGRFCDIGPDVTIGDDCCIESGAKLYGPLLLGDGVFIGPNAVCTNDHFPRAKKKDYERNGTVIGDGASIGANATILPGRIIGQLAMIGAGSVVAHHVPEHECWVGNPARHVGTVDAKDNPHRFYIDINAEIITCSCGYIAIDGLFSTWEEHIKRIKP